MSYDSQIYSVERDLSEVSQAIRAIRNTFVPVNRLPPEILSRVLEYRTRERDLVEATHICQYWRSTLISSPPLWTCFLLQFSPDLDRTLTYLDRSKSAPIDVSITIGSPKDLDVVKYCLAPHTARTRSLVIHESSHSHLASSLFCNPAPSLQHLEIDGWNKGCVCLPDNFLGQQASSLRFVNFNGIRPTFENLFPLPNLTEFHLCLPEGTGPFHMSALFRFFSDSPLLQKVCVSIPSQTVQDIPLDQDISLESLVELEYTYNSGDRVFPYLKLPRLKNLRVFSSLGPREVQRLDDILPYDGRVLLAGATKMSYHSDLHSLRVDLSGNGISASIVVPSIAGAPFVNWFSDGMCIPFGQIEDLEVNGYPTDSNPHVNIFAFENLGVLRIVQWNGHLGDRFLRLFHPDPGAGVPCQSLRKIECAYRGSEGPLRRSLINLARERKRAGYQLELVNLWIAQESDRDLVDELREHVEEVQVGEWDVEMWVHCRFCSTLMFNGLLPLQVT